MARVYLSFLGTNDYVECFYSRDSFEMKYPVRFVQEATIFENCRDWGSEDRIVIFTTKDAHEKNWCDDGHIDPKTQARLQRKGLHSRLADLGLAVPFSREPIPDGHREEEIWDIFDKISGCLDDGDEVVFDITHAFRSIPLLAIVVLNYVKVLKRVKLRGIYYGAFEALGPIPVVKTMPVEERRVRILDLTSLDRLMDWTAATDRFLASGDASLAGELARRGVMGLLRESRGTDVAARAIREMGDAMEAFSAMLFNCRGPETESVACRLKAKLQAAETLDLPRPFIPLFRKLDQRLSAFGRGTFRDGLAAVRWCLEHDLIQQGYTLLEEFIFGTVVEQAGGDLSNQTHREVASQAFTIVSRKWVEEPSKWARDAQEHPELAREMIDFIQSRGGLAKVVEKLRVRRNDLNHAGFTDGYLTVAGSAKFASELRSYLDQTETSLLSE
jgi:CRISPR-associated Csx2 family protein